jgi:hypothetical protein
MTYNTLCQYGPECFFLKRGGCWFRHPTPTSLQANALEKGNDQRNIMLPSEILEKIFRLLPPRDLKTVILVCKFWKYAGEVPGLWTWARFCLNGESLSYWAWIQDLAPLTVWVNAINNRRLEVVRRLMVTQVNRSQAEAIVDGIAADSFLQSLSIHSSQLCLATSDIDETPIKPQKLARSINKLDCKLSDKQAEAIFEEINGDNKLKILRIKNCNLTLVKPEVLALAVNQMTEVSLEYSNNYHPGENPESGLGVGMQLNRYHPGHMTTDHAEAILTQSLLETSLKFLSLGHLHGECDRGVDRNLLSKAGNIIGEVHFKILNCINIL